MLLAVAESRLRLIDFTMLFLNNFQNFDFYLFNFRSIESVIVSLDDGKTWKNAQLKKIERPLYR